MCETHTHVLVKDCSLFPGSSCKTWVRARKVVPLSEMCNPHPQTSLAFATVVVKNGKSCSIPILRVSSSPSISFLHFLITILFYWLHLLTSAALENIYSHYILALMQSRNITSPFAVNSKHCFLCIKWYLTFCCIILGNDQIAFQQVSADVTCHICFYQL